MRARPLLRLRASPSASLIKPWLTQDRIVSALFFVAAFLSVLITAGIVIVLSRESLHFFQDVSLREFFLGTEWAPLMEPSSFGVWPLVCGTLMVTVIAALFAIPLGLACAIYLAEYASPSTRFWMKPLLDLLAGIPSVVYGYFAVVAVTPVLQHFFPNLEFFNALSAGLVVGVMILPTLSTLCEESLRVVPRELREASFALGIKKRQVISGVVLPAASSGITAAFLLGISRAIGETMAVTLAAGATPRLSINPFASIQTMTSYIAQVSLGDPSTGSTPYKSIFAVGLLLFVITFVMNVIARAIMRRLRMIYD